MSAPLNKIGIFAGAGELPLRIAASCQARNHPFHIIAIEEFVDPVPSEFPQTHAYLTQLGKGIATLRRERCKDVVFAGKFERPGGAVKLRPDLTGLWFLIRTVRTLRRGDDTVHRIIAREFEGRGFRVISPLEADPTLAAPAGAISAQAPSEAVRASFAGALAAARAHGATDAGQAVVVKDGNVIAREGRRGTDAMLKELAATGNRGGVMIKALKPTQITNIDPPAIGEATVQAAADAGLEGIVVEAGKSVIVDRVRVAAKADALGLFVYGLNSDAT